MKMNMKIKYKKKRLKYIKQQITINLYKFNNFRFTNYFHIKLNYPV